MIEDCRLIIADCSKAVTSDEKRAGVGSQELEVRRTRERGTGSSSGFVIADASRHSRSTGSLPRCIGVPPVKYVAAISHRHRASAAKPTAETAVIRQPNTRGHHKAMS